MLPPVKRQPNETLAAWESRLIAEYPARERAATRAATMALSDADYRIKVALLTAPPRLAHAAGFPDARTLSDEEYAAAKAALGYHRQSLR